MPTFKKLTDSQKKSNENRQQMLQGLELFDQHITGHQTEFNRVLTKNRIEIAPPPPPAKTRSNPDGMVDIVSFCEHPHFLNLRLTPWQKVILKVFYSGTPGNVHLKLESERFDTGCKGCVWEYNSSSEKEHINTIKQYNKEKDKNSDPDAPVHFRVIDAWMLAENSPCLRCTRFDNEDRKLRYQYYIEQSVTPNDVKERTQWSLRDVEDLFLTEMEMVENDLEPKVKDQLVSKIGNRFQELILVLGRRSGKAVSVDTPILTTTGWKTMGTLEVGEFVFGEDGKPTRIIAATEVMEDHVCYKMSFSNGETIIADANHNWQVVDKKERKNHARARRPRPLVTQVKTTEEIASSINYGELREILDRKTGKVRKMVAERNWSIEIANVLQTSETILPIHPYLLGAWLGDGCSTHSHITSETSEIIDRVSKLTSYKPWKQDFNHYGYCIGKDENGVAFLTTLRREGLLGTGNKYIPNAYLLASPLQRLELLRGIVDTDGHVCARSGRVEITSIHKQLAEDIHSLICSLGQKPTITEGDAVLNGEIVSKKYRVCFTPQNGIVPCSLERKVNRLKQATKSDVGRIFIEKVERLEKPVPVRCIQVDNSSNMFLAGRSLIPTKNSFMVSIITLYEVYKLITMGHPQIRYSLMDFDTITICNVAVSEGQAKTAIFDKIRQLVISSPYFSSYMGKPPTQLEMNFLTPNDVEENKRREKNGQQPLDGTIQLMCGHSNSKSLVGRTMAVVIIDEMAVMAKKSEEGGGTDDDLYAQLKPSIATFGRDGKVICISNPLGPSGKFFQLYRNSFDNPTMLMVQLATWQSNPNIEQSYLEGEKRSDPQSYVMYYGAKFGEAGNEPFIPSEFVHAAFEHSRNKKRADFGEPLMHYFMHLDPAYSSDNYTLVLLHTEPLGIKGFDGRDLQKVVIDHIMIWRPKGKNHPVNVEEVDEYVLSLANRFHIDQISYDHWNSQGSIQKLKARGLNVICTVFNRQYQDLIFQEMYDLFLSQRIEFYDMNSNVINKEGGESLLEVTEAREQILMLQKKWKGRLFKIEALSGHLDDIPDCVASAAYQALKTRVYGHRPKISTVNLGNIFR